MEVGQIGIDDGKSASLGPSSVQPADASGGLVYSVPTNLETKNGAKFQFGKTGGIIAVLGLTGL